MPELPEEYKEFLAQNLNWYEQLIGGLSHLDERIDYTNILLTKLVEAQGITPGLSDVLNRLVEVLSGLTGVSVLDNPETFRVGTQYVAIAGTAEQLPDVNVPFDKRAVVKALRGNLGSVYVGNTKADAEGHNTAYPLWSGEALGLKVANLQRIWLDADNSGEGAVWVVEQDAPWMRRAGADRYPE